MGCGGGLTRFIRALAALSLLSGPLSAQETAPATPETVVSAPILILDRDRLFAESAFGRAVLDRERAALSALEQENSRIQAQLVAEEQDLTEKRQTLPPEEFTALASAFDAKVERIRDEQDAKARDIALARDQDAQDFLGAVVPVLGDLLQDHGAVVILDKSSVILSLTAVDVTDEAIARVDAALPAAPAPAPATP